MSFFKKDGHANISCENQGAGVLHLVSPFVVGVLTALGGKSAIGISLTNVYLWIALLLSCYYLFVLEEGKTT